MGEAPNNRRMPTCSHRSSPVAPRVLSAGSTYHNLHKQDEQDAADIITDHELPGKEKTDDDTEFHNQMSGGRHER